MEKTLLRRPLGVAGTVAAAAMACLSAAFAATFLIDLNLYDQVIWPVVILALITAAAAAGIATRIAMMLPIGAVISAIVVVTAFAEPFVRMRLTSPENVWAGITAVLIVACSAAAAGAGMGATIVRFIRSSR